MYTVSSLTIKLDGRGDKTRKWHTYHFRPEQIDTSPGETRWDEARRWMSELSNPELWNIKYFILCFFRHQDSGLICMNMFFSFFLSQIGLIQIDCVNFSTKSLTLFVITQYMQVDLCRSWRLNILGNSGNMTKGISGITTISHVASNSSSIATVSSISVAYFTFPAEAKWKKNTEKPTSGWKRINS